MNRKQEDAIRYAFDNLKESFECWNDQVPGLHDWIEHVNAIYDLIDAFPTLGLKVPDGFGEHDND